MVALPASHQSDGLCQQLNYAYTYLVGMTRNNDVIKRFHHFMFSFLTIFALSACGSLYAQQTFVMQGPSMQPTIEPGQEVKIVAVEASHIQRGNIVGLASPVKDATDVLVKRVVGLPNEQIAVRGGRVYVNNALLDEPYIVQFCSICDGTWILKSDEYLVLGDNRLDSFDSHSFGPIKASSIQFWVLL